MDPQQRNIQQRKLRAPEHSPDECLKSLTFFHGAKSEVDAVTMQAEGFRSYFVDEEGRWKREGNLGVGNYLSCDWKMALWFGRVLLKVRAEAGTMLLDVRPEPDRRVIEYLKREFGSELLDGKPLHTVIPKRKNFTRDELIEVVRHLYHKTWSGKWSEPGGNEWPRKRRKAAQSLHSAVSLLKRAGLHGYGDPESDNGIVVWASDRIRIERVLATLDPHSHADLVDSERLKELTLNELIERSRSLAFRRR